MTLPKIRIGTRKSPLALRQVDLVVQALMQHSPDFAEQGVVEVVPIVTSGDTFLDASLEDVGGKGLFTKEIDEALLDGRVDIAVHSAKDLQTILPGGITLTAVLPREDARDVLISNAQYTLETLPEAAVLGTASLRRAVQIQSLRPDVKTQLLRGNIQTRMRKIEQGECTATLLALAGLKRMGIYPIPGMVLDVEQMLPAVAQGVIGITCRQGDAHTHSLLARINHTETMVAAQCERALLAALDGSCKTPIAGYATIESGEIFLQGMLGNVHTRQCVRASMRAPIADAEKLGRELAEKLRG